MVSYHLASATLVCQVLPAEMEVVLYLSDSIEARSSDSTRDPNSQAHVPPSLNLLIHGLFIFLSSRN